MEEQLTIEDFGTDELIEEISKRDIEDPLKAIKAILKLKHWHSKGDIASEIERTF